MTGCARALCYRLAIASGLRYSELASLTADSLDGRSETIRAGYAKNGRTSRLPLPPDVADDLAEWVRGMTPSEPMFVLPSRGADMLKSDLRAAGFSYRDGAGLGFDFHSPQCQCATLAANSGVSPRVAQKMIRVSALDLVSRYSRPRVLDIEAATSVRPSLRPSESTPGAVLATTTD